MRSRFTKKALSEDEVIQHFNARGMSVKKSAEKLEVTWGKIKKNEFVLVLFAIFICNI